MIGIPSRHLVAGLLLAVLGVSVRPRVGRGRPEPSLHKVQGQVDNLNRQAGRPPSATTPRGST